MIDPTHPVIVGAHELAVRSADAEPIAMMAAAARGALAETDDRLVSEISSVRVVKGIWPYQNPGRLVAEELGLGTVETALTQIGGNATYDLVNETAAAIAAGELSAAIVCGAESMRTRRKDKSEGRRSTYRDETEGATPDLIVGLDHDLVDDGDIAAGVFQPVNFYAMAETAIRHERGESPQDHLDRISALWAAGSNVAAQNPHAWIPTAHSASAIATPSSGNRMVAAPYTKLLTSNINVDQGAALVLCSYEVAQRHGISDDQIVFLVSGGGAYDPLTIRSRPHLHRSHAFDVAAKDTLDRSGYSIENIEHLDLYSCFPASVQLAQTSLGVPEERPFTLTGGLTFAGGPFNGYCTQALAHVVAALRGTAERAFLYGNGGYFSKHSLLVVSGGAPPRPFTYLRSQDAVDDQATRTLTEAPNRGTLEAYTVTYDRAGHPDRAICSVLDDGNARHWAISTDPTMLTTLLLEDCVGFSAELVAGAGQDAYGRAEPPRAHLT